MQLIQRPEEAAIMVPALKSALKTAYLVSLLLIAPAAGNVLVALLLWALE